MLNPTELLKAAALFVGITLLIAAISLLRS